MRIPSLDLYDDLVSVEDVDVTPRANRMEKKLKPENDLFDSMETLPSISKSTRKSNEIDQPFLDMVKGILTTFQTAAKRDIERAKKKEIWTR